MRYVSILTLIAVLALVGYGMHRNPRACEKLGLDLVADVHAIYVVPTDGVTGQPPGSETVASPLAAVSSASKDPVTTPAAAANPSAVTTSATSSVTLAPPSSAVPAPTASTAQYSVGYVATLPTAPTPIPQPQPAPMRSSYPTFNNYQDGLEAAQKNHVSMLVLFTGSDWCPYCQMLEREVLSTTDFTKFSGSKFVFVTLDDLRNSPMSDSDKSSIHALEQKFNITGFPTMVVIGENETEKGRAEGYNPGSGPAAVIQQLSQFAAR